MKLGTITWARGIKAIFEHPIKKHGIENYDSILLMSYFMFGGFIK